MMTADQEPRPVLDYAQPPRPVSTGQVFEGVCGVAGGFLAATALIVAVACLIAAITGAGNSVAAPGFLWLIFGVVLVVLLREWCRSARGPRP
jgi:hypothetical protein